MKTETLKIKVIKKLERNGNNSNAVRMMIAEHFEFASSHYSSVNKIAECIISL
ncbi:MAG: hypothetical protein HN704_18055 [Bacteroidetes bacterium]|jgi:hypothetical protein|nr:hypothetical protein [Bacteroidota bacterium]